MTASIRFRRLSGVLGHVRRSSRGQDASSTPNPGPDRFDSGAESIRFERGPAAGIEGSRAYAPFSLTNGLLPAAHSLEVQADWEQLANNVVCSGRGTDAPDVSPQRLRYYRIPRELAGIAVLDDARQELRELMFERVDGKDYVRWFVHPADRAENGAEYHKLVATYLKASGVDSTLHEYPSSFRRFASRSVVAPEDKVSLKLSLGNPQGPLRHESFDPNYPDEPKKPPVGAGDANWSMTVSEMLLPRSRTPHLWVQKDVAAATMHFDHPLGPGDSIPVSLGMPVRELAALPEGHFALPGFSMQHPTFSLIALANGETCSAQFGRGRAEDLGRGIAELFASTGLVHSSNHPQNFMVELDDLLRPTGRVALRDAPDFTIHPKVLTAMYGPEVAESVIARHPDRTVEWKEWGKDRIALSAAFNHEAGNPAGGAWLGQEVDLDWMTAFQRAFIERTAELSGWSQAEVENLFEIVTRRPYTYLVLNTGHPRFSELIERLSCATEEMTLRPVEAQPDDATVRDVLRRLERGSASDREALGTLAREEPRAVVRAILVHRGKLRPLEDRVRVELLRALEPEFGRFVGSTEEAMACRALLELGTKDPSILTAQLRHLDSPLALEMALAKLVETRTQDPAVHLAILDLTRADHTFSMILMRPKVVQSLIDLKPRDARVFERAREYRNEMGWLGQQDLDKLLAIQRGKRRR